MQWLPSIRPSVVRLLVIGLGGLAAPSWADGPTELPDAVSEAMADVQQVSLELIMSDPDWLGNAPRAPYWAHDSRSVYFRQKRSGEELTDLWQLDLEGDTPLRVRDEDMGAVDVARGDHSDDRQRRVYSHQGDLFIRALGEAPRQLTRTADRESNPFFMVDETRIAFQRDRQFFVRHLDTGLEEQVADLRLTKDPDAEDDDPSFLESQQLRLFDVIRERDERREAERERQQQRHEADPSLAPPPWFLGDKVEIRQSALAPSGDWMALVVIDRKRDDGRKDLMADWVTEDGYVKGHEVRPKVGTADGTSARLWILDLVSRERHEIDLSTLPGITEDPLAELRRLAEDDSKDAAPANDAANDRGDDEPDKAKTDKAKPRAVRFEEPIRFSPDGSRLLIHAHSYDNKDRWIAVVNRTDMALVPVHRLHNEAWINWSFNESGWLKDSRRLYFLSEETGYSNLYLHDLRSGETRALTEGEQVVSDPELGPDHEHLYYVANPDHPGQYEIYRVNLEGKREQLTRLGGVNSFRLSPDGGQLLVTHSTTTHPPELYVQDARPGAVARRLTHTTSEAFTSLPWLAPEIVAVPSNHHDRPIYSRFYPAVAQPMDDGVDGDGGVEGDGDQATGKPAVIFIHGAGYLQNAHQGWSGYFREFMFHTFLTQRGYAVLDMDYRASKGYGAEWRTAIYRQMGTPELEDLKDGAAWLVSEHGVDPERIGVYGGSYGGFLTMMALFKEPDLFAAGAALRPVTDWAHYNHPYTSNILNTPDVDPGAYARSSPIEFADGLTKPLLICAPMQDDNVFFQDTVRLAQRLIELEKEDWEVAIYPVEPHGFRQPSSWLDEYRRIFKLFESHLW